jgi:hypothetical protein
MADFGKKIRSVGSLDSDECWLARASRIALISMASTTASERRVDASRHVVVIPSSTPAVDGGLAYRASASLPG